MNATQTTQTAPLEKLPGIVGLQFSFTNPEAVPVVGRTLPRETVKMSEARRNREDGDLVLQPTENTSLLEFVEELRMAGYRLVDAFYEPRVDQRNPRRTFHMVRYVFATDDCATPTDAFKVISKLVMDGLVEMCEQAAWQVKGYVNLCYRHREEVIGEKTLMICMNARNPLFSPDGKRLLVWARDATGEKVGERPLEVRPNFTLSIQGQSLAVIKSD